MAIKTSEGDDGAVIVRPKAGGPRFYGKWRHPDDRARQVEVPIGPAWIVPADDPRAKPNGQTLGIVKDKQSGKQRPRWCDRSGSAPDGFLTIRAANRRLPDLYSAWLADDERKRAADKAEEVRAQAVMFADACDSWVAEGETVKGWKPSTVTNMKRYLRRPDDRPARRGTKPSARLMREFGNVPVADIDTRSVKRFLRELDADDDLSARSVNAYRAILLGVLGHAVEEGWIVENAVLAVPKRREAHPAEIVVYTPNQIEAIARRASDPLIAALIRAAAGTGLRLGELLALRWKNIDFNTRRLRVAKSYSAGHGETSPKSRKGRSLPLAENVALELERLREREWFTRQNDLVFCNRAGDHLDPWTTRTRFYEARDEAIAAVEVGSMEVLRFPPLRPAFCTHLANAGVAVTKIQKWAGHANLETTQRYLHAVESDEDVDSLSAAVAPDRELAVA